MILENKRLVCLPVLSFLFGIILYVRKEDVWWALLIVLGMSLAFLLLTGRNRTEVIIAALLSAVTACTAFFLCRYQDLSYLQVQKEITYGADTEICGTIYQKECKSDSYLYYLRTEYKKVLIYYETDEIPIGSSVMVCGEAEAFSHAVNDGNFDLADYYQYKNISFRIFPDTISIQNEPEFSFRECLYQVQKRISAVFDAELNEYDAGVLSTLVTGNKGLLDQEVKDLYQDAGISHILAISGMHISILGMGIFRFLRKLRWPYPAAAGVGSMAVLCFVIMSGMGVSARRALIMYLILMGAEVLGRAYDMLNALALAALVILAANPMELYQSGFEFSFLAMAAIVLSERVMAKFREEQVEKEGRVRFSKCKRKEKHTGTKNDVVKGEKIGTKIKGKLVENLLFGAFLQLFLMPLTAWLYYEVPIYALFLNLLVIPLCSWLLGFGLLGGITGLFWPRLSKWILVVCHFILLLYKKAIGLVSLLPCSEVITGKPLVWVMLLYYGILVSACLWYLYEKEFREERTYLLKKMRKILTCDDRRQTLSKREVKSENRNQKENFRKSECCIFGNRKRDFPISCVVRIYRLIPIFILAWILFIPKREACTISFLDVGQGDGIYLTDGAGTHVMIDEGSSSVNEVGEYRIEPFLKYHGVRKVDVWILTHSDSDHYSGLLELLEDGYPVEYLLFSQSMPRDETWESLTTAAAENGTEIVYVEARDAIRLSDCDMTCIYPTAEDTSEDSNDLSQVWLFEKDEMSILFTGDLGEEQEQLLLERGLLGDVDVLKVAHHGSKYSSCEEFLKAVSPEYAVISCGEGNSYGHPHAETLERLGEVGCDILQTQESGQITFSCERGVWRLNMYQ